MTPLTVRFTGLEIDPALLHERCIRGVIPPSWQRYRFPLDAEISYPVNKLNRWLQSNIEGRWAIYHGFTSGQRDIVIAFESDLAAMTFLMADGKTQAFKDP
jgi:hypothetical protein